MHQRSESKPLGEILIAIGELKPDDLRRTLSVMLDVPAVDLATTPCDPMVLDDLPKNKAFELSAIPLFSVEHQLTVAIPDPDNLIKLDELRFATGKEILPVLALESDIEVHLKTYYGERETTGGDDLEFERPDGSAIEEGVEIEEAVEDRPVVRLVNMVIVRAIQEFASDIHFEPQQGGMKVRYRIDGRLRPKPFLIPSQAISPVVSRIKILSNLDISERRRPQDGKIRIRYRGRAIDVRTSTCPNIYGEKVVLRLLDKERQDYSLDTIGMSPHVLESWRKMLHRRQGIVLVTGPTGSGKSSTLYATLRHLNEPDVNIATLEDPVEYELKGVSQSQVNVRAGFTFAGGLRSLLRQDPDIILVGEIRDAETAEIAVQAALTGHLVLATLHTNDAPTAVTRLVDMGVPRYLAAATMMGVLAQRLIRRACPDCQAEAQPDDIEADIFKPILEAGLSFHEGSGCATCNGAGYNGRTGVHEVLEIDRNLQQLISAGSDEQAIADAARDRGYRPMWWDGIDKVRGGLSTLRELARCVSVENDERELAVIREEAAADSHSVAE
jgi:type IV pilus assembly protein PilB